MRNSKKRFVSIFSALTIGASSVVAASCGIAKDEREYAIVTDGGTILDKSFNQSAYEAFQELMGVETQDKWVYQPKEGKIQAKYKDLESANTVEGKIALLPGFMHTSELKNYLSTTSKTKLNYLLLDDNYNPDGSSKKADRVASITFDLLSTSYALGYALVAWFNTPETAEVSKDVLPVITPWLGAGSSSGVAGFLAGMIYGIIDGNEDYKNTPSFRMVQIGKEGNNDSWAKQFTTGFGATSENASSLVDNSALFSATGIFYPVAGPQTQLAIAAITKGSDADKKNKKIIGVDTDQAKVYREDYFLTSLTKGIKTMLVDAAKALKGKTDTNPADKAAVEVAVTGAIPTDIKWNTNLNAKFAKDRTFLAANSIFDIENKVLFPDVGSESFLKTLQDKTSAWMDLMMQDSGTWKKKPHDEVKSGEDGNIYGTSLTKSLLEALKKLPATMIVKK